MTRDGAIVRLPAATTPATTILTGVLRAVGGPASLLLGLLVLFPSTTKGSEIREGVWQAWLDSPGGELPFQLEIQRDDEGHHAWLLSGEERLAVPGVRVGNDGIELEFPHFDAVIEASPSPDGGQLDGTWARRAGEVTRMAMPFHATAGDPSRSPPHDDTPLAERWLVEAKDSPYPAVALFETTNSGDVHATFQHSSGDSRILTGGFQDQQLRLSRFDGGQPMLVVARMQPDGTLEGTSWYGSLMSIRWTARPDPEASIPDPFQFLQLDSVDLDAVVAFDLDGTPSSLGEALPPGRAWIIEILGTWCPNCHEASTFLMQLREEYGERGLAVLGLAFQMSSNFERNVADVRRYGKRNGIGYPVLLASSDAPISPSFLFPPRSGQFAFPTVLFLDRDQHLYATYTGFSGPSTGTAHESMARRWREVIEEMLNEGD
jgi:thiol-disulfide isomerase/thioredoxin